MESKGPGLRKADTGPIDYVLTTARGAQSEAVIRFLEEQGLPVEDFEGSPAFREAHTSEYRQALKLLFENRIDGWWNLRLAMLREQVCSEGEFKKVMKEKVA